MIIFVDLLLVITNLIHLLKHWGCRCKPSEEEEFDAFPIIFFIYSISQCAFSLSLTCIYIFNIVLTDTVKYGSNHGNASNVIPQILLYPFQIDNSNEKYLYFSIPKQGFNMNITQNYIVTINVCILFLLYTLETFMHWYRYYTVYFAHKYLTHTALTDVLKYYVVYILIFIAVIALSVILQNYVGILIVIVHLSIGIYLSNQHMQILFKSTKDSISNPEHVEMLMAPLYPTRRYSILSTISSTLYLVILIVSNTFNSIIYYPIFACSTTFLLSLIFVRNRQFVCSYCVKQKPLHYTHSESDHHRSCCFKTQVPVPSRSATVSMTSIKRESIPIETPTNPEANNIIIKGTNDVIEDVSKRAPDMETQDKYPPNLKIVTRFATEASVSKSAPVALPVMHDTKSDTVRSNFTIDVSMHSPDRHAVTTQLSVHQNTPKAVGRKSISVLSTNSTGAIDMKNVAQKLNQIKSANANVQVHKQSPWGNPNVLKPNITRPSINYWVQPVRNEQMNQEQYHDTHVRNRSNVSYGTISTFPDLDEMMQTIVDDEDVFDYNCAKTRYIDHENTISMGSVATISRVPSQRPSSIKTEKKFWSQADTKDDTELPKMSLQASRTSQLDVHDLTQHLEILKLLRSQGLMQNPVELLRFHQKLQKKGSRRSKLLRNLPNINEV